MELRVLRYFVEAAREQNITRAAMRLHVTQPTLSRQLKDLEQELGQKLFIRSNYSIHLTPEGNLLYQRALDILDMADKTIAEFDAMQDFQGGDLHIGCAESDGICWIARAFQQLQERYPNIRLHLYSANAQQTMERLDKGLLDFAVVVQKLDLTRYASLTLPSRNVWGILLPRNSLLSKQKTIPIQTLATLPLIVSRQGITSEMPEWLIRNQDRLHIVATYDLIYNASVLVREGVGYALGLDKLVDTSQNSALCFRPLEPKIESPLYLIWSRTQTRSKQAALLLEQVHQFDI